MTARASRVGGPDRRLAAVWFADIAGFTNLSSRDEDAAMKLVKILQDVTRRAVEERGGTVVKFLGDGGLAVFSSADAAVRTGLTVQRTFETRTAAMGSAARLRIGVHIGEVISSPDGDVYGDGVNTAARIQREAEPGRVVVSEDVQRQIRQRAGYHLEALGERTLRGIDEPVQLYAVAGAPDETEVPEPSGARRASSTAPARRTLALATGAVAVGVIGWWAIAGREANRPAAGSAPVAATRAASSIAVLPFADMSPGHSNEYFSDGMTEELINALTRVEGLAVVSRTSVFEYKNQNLDIRRIGQRLGVETVLEGSVRVAGDRIRITAQLVDVDNGYHLWSETYDRDMEDVFAVQEEIARAIVTALEPELAIDERIVARHTGDPEAYKLYLQGRYFWYKRTEEGLMRAIEFFEAAIRADSTYALAYTGLADSYQLLRVRGFRTANETIEREREYTQKALELDPALSEAHTSLAWFLFNHDWDWEAAGREFERAVELDPRNYNARHWYSHYLMAMGRVEESLEHSLIMVDIAPLDVTANVHLGWHYLSAREYEKAVEQLLKAEAMDPQDALAHAFLAQAYAFQGKREEALAECREILALPRDSQALGAVASVYARFGRTQEALGIARDFVERRGSGGHLLYAVIHAQSGDRDGALDWLEKGYVAHAAGMQNLNADPRLDPVRDDPRFQSLLRRMDLE